MIPARYDPAIAYGRSIVMLDNLRRTDAEEGSRRLLTRQLQTGQHYLDHARYAAACEALCLYAAPPPPKPRIYYKPPINKGATIAPAVRNRVFKHISGRTGIPQSEIMNGKPSTTFARRRIVRIFRRLGYSLQSIATTMDMHHTSVMYLVRTPTA